MICFKLLVLTNLCVPSFQYPHATSGIAKRRWRGGVSANSASAFMLVKWSRCSSREQTSRVRVLILGNMHMVSRGSLDWWPFTGENMRAGLGWNFRWSPSVILFILL